MALAVKMMASPLSPERTEGVHQSHSPESSHVPEEETTSERSPPRFLKFRESGSAET